MIKFVGIILFVSTVISLKAQWITHGPVTGGVTDSSANLFLRCSTNESFTIQLDTDSLFSNPLLFSNVTDPGKDFSAITSCSGLNSNTMYFYRVVFNSSIDNKKGSFRTFPAEGLPSNFSFVTGSCQETPNMKVYDVIPTHHPLFMVHSGDYTYPSYQLPASYPVEWSSIALSYRKRYEELVMKDKLLPFIPLVYMPDDDDNWGISRTQHIGTSYSGSFPNIQNFINTSPISQVERTNCLRGYRYFFPGYATIDTTEGHYHSFKVANAEFFVTDTRSMADPYSDAYQFDSITGLWSFVPDISHSILGTNQMNWLLNGLSTSTAKWKFIVSGVPFNPKFTKIIEAGLLIQGYVFNVAGENGTGLRLSTSFADCWGGYPDDITTLIQHVSSQQINNIIVLSGQTHNNVMDDGTNSFFPELNASGLSVSSTELAYQMALNAPLFGQPPVVDSLWNAGGNGLFNTNFKNGFGKVDVYGQDSVVLCVIDEDNITLSCMTVYGDGSVNNDAGVKLNGYLSSAWTVYPNPSSNSFMLRFDNLPEEHVIVSLCGLTGELYKVWSHYPFSMTNSHSFQLPESIPNGMYLLKVQGAESLLSVEKKLVIIR